MAARLGKTDTISNRVVIAGGCVLAFGAAFANAGLVLQTGTSVSHMTGDIATLTLSLARWSNIDLSELTQVSVAAFCFLFASFFLGGLAGGVTHLSGNNAIAIAGVGYCLAGLSWRIRKKVVA